MEYVADKQIFTIDNLEENTRTQESHVSKMKHTAFSSVVDQNRVRGLYDTSDQINIILDKLVMNIRCNR